MESFKITETFGTHCDECGKTVGGQVSNTLEVKGVVYTLCEDCFKRFLGTLYNGKPKVFEELISTLAKKDRQAILDIINRT